MQTTAGYVPGEDLLKFTNTPTITGSFDAETGLLTLTPIRRDTCCIVARFQYNNMLLCHQGVFGVVAARATSSRSVSGPTPSHRRAPAPHRGYR